MTEQPDRPIIELILSNCRSTMKSLDLEYQTIAILTELEVATVIAAVIGFSSIDLETAHLISDALGLSREEARSWDFKPPSGLMAKTMILARVAAKLPAPTVTARYKQSKNIPINEENGYL